MVWLWLGVAMAEEVYQMKEAGLSFTLPPGWTVPRWSDWDLDAINTANTVQVQVVALPFQVPPSEEAMRGWTLLTANRLRDLEHERVEMVTANVVGDKAEIEMKYKYQGQSWAVLYQRSFNTEGRTVHVSATAVKPNERKAFDALDTWMGALKVDKAPGDLAGLSNHVQVKEGFGALLPPGWRVPLESERKDVLTLAGQAGHPKLDGCWMAFRPYPDGGAALMFACPVKYFGGVLDELSAADVEGGLCEEVFGKAICEKIPPGEAVSSVQGETTSLLYRVPVNGTMAQLVAGTPYVGGYVLTWAVGPAGDVGRLEESLKAVLVSTELPEGSHKVGPGQWVSYAVAHRPVYLVPPALLVLAVVGGIGFMVRRASQPREHDHQ